MSKYLKLQDVPRGIGHPGAQRAAWWDEALATPPGSAYEVELKGRTMAGLGSSIRLGIKKYAPDGHLGVVQRGNRLFIVNRKPSDDH